MKLRRETGYYPQGGGDGKETGNVEYLEISFNELSAAGGVAVDSDRAWVESKENSRALRGLIKKTIKERQ